MPETITYLHKRNMINQLSKKERDALLKQMIENDIDLTDEEEKYLSHHNMKAYIGKFMQRAGHLTPYELGFADETEKDIYILNDMRLDILYPIYHSLDDEWRQKILSVSVFSNKRIPDSLFDQLSEKDKKYYANLSIVNSAYLSPGELRYLTSENQRKIIDQIIGRGEDFRADQFESFTAENKKYYFKKLKERKNLKESLRDIIKNVISEVVE
jgi:hypothetical protein